MKIALISFVALILGFYFLCGVVVVQPIGAVPEGGTLIYFRPGTELPFLTSPDGFLLDKGLDVSLLGRGLSAAELVKRIDDRRIARLPYFKQLYLWSTGGQEFER